MKITLELEYEEARALCVLTAATSGHEDAHAQLDALILNADESRWLHLEEAR